MCFAPYVSLSTFIIEFALAIFFLLKNPKDKLNRIIALTSFLLGFYQLNEFLICTTNINIFTKLALVTIAILPSLAISYTLVILRKKIKLIWHLLIYAPAAFFVLMATISSVYKQPAICSTVFIQYPSAGLIGKFFGLYYVIFLLASVILFYIASFKTKTKQEKTMHFLGMLGILLFTIPTYIFLLFLPALEIQTSSVLCEFALLLAIEFIIVLWYKEKHNLHY
jgi:hypothetical protein